jgi:hypothetical protein
MIDRSMFLPLKMQLRPTNAPGHRSFPNLLATDGNNRPIGGVKTSVDRRIADGLGDKERE